MQGDFTRLTFNRSKHYSGVLNQQGRVALDADWNEQVAIEQHDMRTTRQDVIGLCGGPQGVDAAGDPLASFDVTTDGAALSVTKGRYYVDGILAQKEATTGITAQPDLPVASLAQVAGLAPNAALPAGAYLAYLDVWERHITALEDASIREVALGGPDTTTRTQVMAQVKLLRVGDAGIAFDCATQSAAWDTLTAASSGQLEAQAEPDDPSESRQRRAIAGWRISSIASKCIASCRPRASASSGRARTHRSWLAGQDKTILTRRGSPSAAPGAMLCWGWLPTSGLN